MGKLGRASPFCGAAVAEYTVKKQHQITANLTLYPYVEHFHYMVCYTLTYPRDVLVTLRDVPYYESSRLRNPLQKL